MKFIASIILAATLASCATRDPNQPPLTPAQIEAREQARRELQARGFTVLDNLIAFIPRAPGSTRGFAK